MVGMLAQIPTRTAEYKTEALLQLPIRFAPTQESPNILREAKVQ
jgi:hypothetical protein